MTPTETLQASQSLGMGALSRNKALHVTVSLKPCYILRVATNYGVRGAEGLLAATT